MKYMILLYGSQQDYDALTGKAVPGKPAWGPEDFAAMGTFMMEFSKDLTESGELVETRGLTAPVHARRIQLVGGAPVVDAAGRVVGEGVAAIPELMRLLRDEAKVILENS